MTGYEAPHRTARLGLHRLAAGVLLGIAVLIGLPAAAGAATFDARAQTALPADLASSLPAGLPAGLKTGPTPPLTAQVGAMPAAPQTPADPTGPVAPTVADNNVTVSVPGQHSQVLQIILLVTVLGVAPAILLLCTSFTKIVVVLSLTRSALGTPSIPPNQVLVGLALFLSLFVMGPTIDQMQKDAIQPYSAGKLSATEAYQAATVPLRDFMLKHTRDDELALMTKAAAQPLPSDRNSVDLRTLIPAFVLSELRGAFIIGFVVFVPFLVVDIVVSAILMSLGMVMLPPSLVSLPFKLLLFVLVDGWSLIVTTLLGSYR
jgi:flagellar biosynthetic protein FliP